MNSFQIKFPTYFVGKAAIQSSGRGKPKIKYTIGNKPVVTHKATAKNSIK